MCKHGTKNTLVFLPKATRKHKFLDQEDRSGLRKPLITATSSVYVPKPVSTDLTIKPDSVLTNPMRKGGV